MASEQLAKWKARGKMYDVFGRRVFAVVEGPPDAEPLLVLHGFPTCSMDFERALPVLAAKFRVIIHDHLGFGLSEKPAVYSYSLLEQAEIACGLWRSLGVKRGHVLGHDYGTSVAAELAALRERGLLPFDLLSITLTNGSVLVELAHLRLAQRILRNQTIGPTFARMSSLGLFKRQIRNILGKQEQVKSSELEALFEAITLDDGRERLSQISQYIDERTRFRERWFGALCRFDRPAHLLWGKLDPIAVPAIPEKLHASMKKARLTWIEDLGHYPMLEDPDRWASMVVDGIQRDAVN
jgi:pimeloyl-ACP methyl ester carboxylesterase